MNVHEDSEGRGDEKIAGSTNKQTEGRPKTTNVKNFYY
jgi:hypothetical protein